MTILIRAAQASDAAAIAHIHAESWRVAYRGMLSDDYLDGPIDAERAHLWQTRFANPTAGQFTLVAQSDGEPLGFVCAYGGHDQEWGTFIDNLHVLPASKRKGIGARLMAKVAAWSAQAYPGQGIYLWVLETNTPARKFYERIGARHAGTDVWQPPDGSALPKLRYVWPTAQVLAAGTVDHVPPGQ